MRQDFKLVVGDNQEVQITLSTFKKPGAKPQPISEQIRAKTKINYSEYLKEFSNNLPTLPKDWSSSGLEIENINDLTLKILCDALTKEQLNKL